MSDDETKNERRARGLATYKRVYGDDAPLPAGGSAEFFDLLIIDQQFSEVWSREALPIASRRLLTMGVLAATRRFDILEIQFARVLETGELTEEQVREVVIHLTSYVVLPRAGTSIAQASLRLRDRETNKSRPSRVHESFQRSLPHAQLGNFVP